MSSSARGSVFPGWEALFKIVEKDLSHKSDLLIVLLHYFLVNQNNYLCLGVGENKAIDADETGSELLPEGWNADENRYTLRYIFENRLYTVLALRSEGTFIINFLEVHTICVATLAIDIDDKVQQMDGAITDMVPTVNVLFDRMRKELLAPMTMQPYTHAGTQTEDKGPSRPILVNAPQRQVPDGNMYFQVRPERNARDVGRADLNPFGIGGGMLMPEARTLPFNAIPHRYDPIFPDDLSVDANRPRRRGPNPDHMRPPSFDYL